MTLRTIVHPDTGTTYKMGRLRPPRDRPRLLLSKYRLSPPLGIVDVPSRPAFVNYATPAAATCLDSAYGNRDNGDCTIAGVWHLLGVFFGSVGLPIPSGLTTAAALALYYRLTGGQDTGLDEVGVLEYWMANAVVPGTSPISAHADVDASDWDHVADAAFAFENLYSGMELPEAWVTTDIPREGAANVWDVAGDPNPDNGHCVPAFGYGAGSALGLSGVTAEGILANTWGIEVLITRAAVAAYMTTSGSSQGELHTVLTPDIVARASQRAPNSYNYAQLLADIEG